MVSIPNGKPGPLRRRIASRLSNGSASFNPKREARPSQTKPSFRASKASWMFQSQTGSQALSDSHPVHATPIPGASFNPKREARPSQTKQYGCWHEADQMFQSQTGSQALSDAASPIASRGQP